MSLPFEKREALLSYAEKKISWFNSNTCATMLSANQRGVSYEMNADAFRHFYNYHFAENRKLWDRYITQLTSEQFT